MSDERLNEHQSWIQELVRQHEASLIRYALSIVGCVDTARDVVQESFLRLCRQDREAIEGHEPAWLFRVCHNLALNHHRKERRMHTSSEAIVTQESTRSGGPSKSGESRSPDDPAEAASSAEEHQLLWDCIDGLPSNQQQVLRLKFRSGLPYRDIAAATGLSESNVGYLLHTALKTLRVRFTPSDA